MSARTVLVEGRHGFGGPIGGAADGPVNVGDRHDALRETLAGVIDHRAVNHRVRPAELAYEGRDGDLLVVPRRPDEVDLQTSYPSHERKCCQRLLVPAQDVVEPLHAVIDE